MKLESQVISLKLAKKLKELGVKQESLFVWEKGKPLERSNIEVTVLRYIDDGEPFKEAEIVSAFTVAEMGKLLSEVEPDVIQLAYNFVFNVESSRFITSTGLQRLLANPDLCAKLLIYLLENKLITL